MTPDQRERLRGAADGTRIRACAYSGRGMKESADAAQKMADAIDAALKRIERLEEACKRTVQTYKRGAHMGTAIVELSRALEGRD